MNKDVMKELKELGFIVNLKGKEFILYDGLMFQAHRLGLKAIKTDLIQIPNKENENMAISKAVVIMQDDKEFHGIGDSDDKNTGSMVRVHKIRMSETRAKARALRDATGITMSSLEELDGHTKQDDLQKMVDKQIEENKKLVEENMKLKKGEFIPRTEAQRKQLFALVKEKNLDNQIKLIIAEKFDVSSSKDLDKKQTAQLIDDLKNNKF